MMLQGNMHISPHRTFSIKYPIHSLPLVPYHCDSLLETTPLYYQTLMTWVLSSCMYYIRRLPATFPWRQQHHFGRTQPANYPVEERVWSRHFWSIDNWYFSPKISHAEEMAEWSKAVSFLPSESSRVNMALCFLETFLSLASHTDNCLGGFSQSIRSFEDDH